MNEMVELSCHACGKTVQHNFIRGYIYGWPKCCAVKRMVVTAPVPEDLKSAAFNQCMLPKEQRVHPWTVVKGSIEPARPR